MQVQVQYLCPGHPTVPIYRRHHTDPLREGFVDKGAQLAAPQLGVVEAVADLPDRGVVPEGDPGAPLPLLRGVRIRDTQPAGVEDVAEWMEGS